MRSVVDGTFLEERDRLRLRSTCEECVHFDEKQLECSHGYPTEDHRQARALRLGIGEEVVFCKEWELR